MKNHIKFMTMAINLAKEGKASENGGAFGAVITLDDKVICKVHNTVKGDSDVTQHAELKAIQKACKKLKTTDLSSYTLYTSCEPCMMCLGACKWAKFKAIYFGASAEDAKQHGYIYSEMYYDSENKKRHEEFNMIQICKEEAIKVWQ
ncbi:nucleoside deaminase [Winogradskyella litorisediminis]|uniref:Nucleoside deaminase n=1 Tax=Winogradskyella litorisediminis TaxID=1156618 RepID=A0ABW3N440_9FLAO